MIIEILIKHFFPIIEIVFFIDNNFDLMINSIEKAESVLNSYEWVDLNE
jgi:hypothetical protein